MIYVYSKPGEMIILSNNPRDLKQDVDEDISDESPLQNSNLLFTIDLDFDNAFIKNNLRRWLILWRNNTNNIRFYKYKPIIVDWLRSIRDEGISSSRPLNYNPKLILNSEKERLIKSFLETKSLLVKNNIIKDESAVDTKIDMSMLEFDCDVYNYLDELYPNLSETIIEYSLLSDKKKSILQKFYDIKTRDSQISYLRNNGDVNISEIASFLPDWCIFGLLVSEDDLRKSNEKWDNLPEFRNKKKIDNKDFLRLHKDLLVRNEVFRSFKINEVWVGDKIKEKIREIYQKFEYTDGKPRISEINKYFEVNKTRQGYRIGYRKLTKYT
jgi:hypothetical protein